MKFSLPVNGKDITVEVNDTAEQANGSCFVRYGDTMVLTTATMSREEKHLGFFPLTVEYEERYYAAGKIYGARFIRRESRPSEEAIITARVIDRAIRPLFPKGFMREVQVVTTCLSWDAQNDPDILGLVGASTALSLSDIPWTGPVGAVRVCKVDGKFMLNPTYEEREKSDLDIVFVGVKEGNDILVNMIEAESKEVTEDEMEEAYRHAVEPMSKMIDFQSEIQKKLGKEKLQLKAPEDDIKELEAKLGEIASKKLEEVLYLQDKGEQYAQKKQILEEMTSYVKEKYPDNEERIRFAKSFFEQESDRIIHENIIQKERRPDGRKIDQVRDISCEVQLIPRTHGSALFRRGQTKALSILTLGAPGDVKILQGMEIVGKKRFMHHYNFPPYSVGEVKPMRGPGRREIGHGMLAEKALVHLVPPFEEFPYTIRVVTEVLSSNGSTSMASTCAACLALMDAGVPIKAPVAGIAIGLMSNEKGEYKVLTDIQGPEDAHGDMDFKVAGTRKGITAIQLDVKVKGISEAIFKEALIRGKKARSSILDVMEKTLAEPRKELSPHAPRVLQFQIHPDKIRDVVGPGGKVINEIIDETGVSIDIEDDGSIFITAEKKESGEKALQWIKDLTREIKEGEVFEGKVKRILDFGAFVEILPNVQGLVHISELENKRTEKVTDVVNIGDVFPVKVIKIDEEGRIDLSRKAMLDRQESSSQKTA